MFKELKESMKIMNQVKEINIFFKVETDIDKCN